MGAWRMDLTQARKIPKKKKMATFRLYSGQRNQSSPLPGIEDGWFPSFFCLQLEVHGDSALHVQFYLRLWKIRFWSPAERDSSGRISFCNGSSKARRRLLIWTS